MTKLYDAHGILFRYPEVWDLEEEAVGDSYISITLHASQTASWSVTIMPDQPEIAEVLESAVEVYVDEYNEVDVFDVELQMAHFPCEGRDVEFVCLELLNRAELRCFRTPVGTFLVTTQGTDTELEDLQPFFDETSQSLEIPDSLLTEGRPPSPETHD